MLIVDVLGDLGYQPLEAVDAAMALRCWNPPPASTFWSPMSGCPA